MSLSRNPKSQFPDWRGPFYPPAIKAFAAALDGRPFSGRELERAMRRARVPGFDRCFRTEAATDGYSWFWLLRFGVFGGWVIIAVPWGQDAARADGSRLDRSPAVYTIGRWVRTKRYNDTVALAARALQGLGL